MRSAPLFFFLAAFSLLTSTLSSSQQIDPRSGAVCEPTPSGMSAVRERAEAGDAVAEYEVGRSMLSSKPTDQEVAAAMPWFRRSAEQGYAPAEYIYGDLFREGRWKNPQQLVYWWTKAAEQGEVRAQSWLGAFYEQGSNGVERDYHQAFKWLSRAARQGQPDAQVSLGQMYENGEGIPENYRVAAYWYRKAADHVPDLGGAGAGLSSLVQLYREGHASKEDYIFLYVAFATGGDADGLRDVTEKMNSSQLVEAQRRITEWVQALHAPSLCSSAMGKDVAASQSQ
jgi:TPR repeat protein